MTNLQRAVIVLFIVVTHSVCGQEAEQGTKKKLEYPSPDGQFAFRTTGDADSENQTYHLVEKRSGKLLMSVAEFDSDIGPSARFDMEVLWRPDSKAFALTATLWKRGSEVSVYVRDGSTFRKIKLPELEADIPEKVMKGREFPHVVELSSQSAKKWQKDGSLVVEIESIQDGNEEGLTATANRTVVLGFDQSGKAKVRKSTIKYKVEKE